MAREKMELRERNQLFYQLCYTLHREKKTTNSKNINSANEQLMYKLQSCYYYNKNEQ